MLSKIKALGQIKATKIFTDREQARDSFSNALNSYATNQKKLVILMYYGVGGIGKSTLLNRLRQSTHDNKEFHIISIDLDASLFTSLASSLLAIRNQMDIPCFAFEYALTRYWQVEGRSLDDIQRQVVKKDSLLFDFIDAVANVAGVFAPAKLLYEIAQSGSKAWHKWFSQEKLLIQQIDSFTEKEIEEHLPYYLGSAIEKAAANEKRLFVFFIDTHEKLLSRPSGDGWLQELIASSENGLFVIAGREYLKWSDANSEWSKYLEQHILGELTDTDAEYFLSKIPVDDVQVSKSIVHTAHGVPLYLDLCASIYIMKKQSGQNISAEDFRGAEKEVIERFFSHLDREQSEALKIVATLSQFDYTIFVDLMKEMSVGFPSTLFREFCETSFASEINKEYNIFKIHDIVREFVHNEMDVNAYMIFRIIVEHCERNFTAKDIERISWVYQQAFHLLRTYNLTPKIKEANALTQIGILLIDKGAWKEVEKTLINIDHHEQKFARFRFLQALCLRKRGALRDADQAYKEILEVELEPWTPLIRFHAAHVSHLLGNYDRAYKVYKDLMSLREDNSVSREAKLLAIRQGADILMLKGKFRDALTTFTQLTEINNDEIWQAETNRFQGHVYRFNFELSKAEKHYNNALELGASINAIAMQGKALTNLAETLCWLSPQTALKYSDLAIDMNDQANAPIEIGKALTAKAIALSLEKPDEAIQIASNAENLQSKNGYKSGILFALNAKGLALISSNQIDEAQRILNQINDLSKSLGDIYPYYPLILTYLLLKPEKLRAYNKRFQWLDFNQTKLSIQTIVKNFNNSKRIFSKI